MSATPQLEPLQVTPPAPPPCGGAIDGEEQAKSLLYAAGVALVDWKVREALAASCARFLLEQFRFVLFWRGGEIAGKRAE